MCVRCLDYDVGEIEIERKTFIDYKGTRKIWQGYRIGTEINFIEDWQDRTYFDTSYRVDFYAVPDDVNDNDIDCTYSYPEVGYNAVSEEEALDKARAMRTQPDSTLSTIEEVTEEMIGPLRCTP
jgi:hypothetical protein